MILDLNDEKIILPVGSVITDIGEVGGTRIYKVIGPMGPPPPLIKGNPLSLAALCVSAVSVMMSVMALVYSLMNVQ